MDLLQEIEFPAIVNMLLWSCDLVLLKRVQKIFILSINMCWRRIALGRLKVGPLILICVWFQIRRGALQDHIKEGVERHLDLVCLKLEQVELEFSDKLEQVELQLSDKLEQAEWECAKLKESELQLSDKLEQVELEFSDKLKQVELECSKLKKSKLQLSDKLTQVEWQLSDKLRQVELECSKHKESELQILDRLKPIELSSHSHHFSPDFFNFIINFMIVMIILNFIIIIRK